MIKSRFRSRTEHTLDAKGRLNFPSRFREVLLQYDTDILIVTSWMKKHLRVYPISEWEILETKLMNEGRRKPKLASFARYVVGGVTECRVDKQGRMLLPQPLRIDADLKKDIVITGMLDWIEIWDRDAMHAENEATCESCEDYSESLAELGIF